MFRCPSISENWRVKVVSPPFAICEIERCIYVFFFTTDADRIALAAQNFAKQAGERLKLQEALQCEHRRLEDLRFSATSSSHNVKKDDIDAFGSDSEEDVTFSKKGRSEMIKIEG
jgi:hypothetical protein